MTALVPSLGSRAVTLSAVLHAAAITALVLTSIFGPERWPELEAASAHVPMILDVVPVATATPPRRLVRPALSSLPRRRPSAPQAPSSEAPAPAGRVIREAEAPADPGPGAEMTGCTTGCVVAGGEPGPGDPTSGAGAIDGAPAVVSIVPGGVIRPPRKVRDRAPAYPELAIRSRVEGRVDIDCRIDPGGRVVDAAVTRGHPLLSGAALEAVRQWLYEPTLLNGVPVSVVMTVTVHFRLHR